MKVGDLIIGDDSTERVYGIITNYIEDDWVSIWPYCVEQIDNHQLRWYDRSEMESVDITELPPEISAKMSTSDVFRLIREKLNESR